MFVEKPQYKGQVQAALKDMMYTTIAYLQMTQVCAHNTGASLSTRSCAIA